MAASHSLRKKQPIDVFNRETFSPFFKRIQRIVI